MENNSSQDSSNSFYFVKLYICWFAEYNYLTYLLNKVSTKLLWTTVSLRSHFILAYLWYQSIFDENKLAFTDSN